MNYLYAHRYAVFLRSGGCNNSSGVHLAVLGELEGLPCRLQKQSLGDKGLGGVFLYAISRHREG